MILYEGEVRARANWIEKLICGPEEFDALIDHGLFLRQRDQTWRLVFVGSFCLTNMAWICLPAGFIGQDVTMTVAIQRTFACLLTYIKRSAARDNAAESLAHVYGGISGSRPAREIELFFELIAWTDAFGIYTAHVERLSARGGQSVHWPKTLSKSHALHSRNATTYDPLATISSEKQLTSLSVEQSRVLLALYAKYSALLALMGVDFDEIERRAESIAFELQEVPSLSLSNLHDELSSTNFDHERDLISLLIGLKELGNLPASRSAALELFGTVSFELVWEDICRKICESISITPKLSNPYYLLDGLPAVASARQKPDVTIQANGAQILLDAKYYPRFPSSLPQLEDIRKQIFYALSWNEGTVGTTFIFPGEVTKHVGTVAMFAPGNGDEYADLDRRFPRVSCITLSWSEALLDYAMGTTTRSLPLLLDVLGVLPSKTVTH